MTPDQRASPIAVLAGGGEIPFLACRAILAQGRLPIILAIAGEADPTAFSGVPVYPFRWGEVGRLWRILEEHGCREILFIGSVSSRPDLKSIKLDFGAIPLLPRVAQLLRRGDDGLLSGIARIFAEHGFSLVSILDVAPHMALTEGALTKRRPSPQEQADVDGAAEAARMLGSLDIGQAAVSVGGRVVAVEGAEGTDGLLARVGEMRLTNRIPRSGGVLVKVVKPHQDRRIDLPTIGPATARRAVSAGLSGVAGTAGATLLAGREETVAAFDEHALFLVGLPDHAESAGQGRSR